MHEIFKSSIKLTLCAGATSKQAKSRSDQSRPIDPVKRIHFTDVKTTQTISYVSIKFLFKDLKNGRKGEVPASSIKGNQNIFNSFDSQGLPEDYQVGYGFLTNFKKQVPLFNRPKAEKNIPDKAVSKLQIKEGIFRLRCIFWHK